MTMRLLDKLEAGSCKKPAFIELCRTSSMRASRFIILIAVSCVIALRLFGQVEWDSAFYVSPPEKNHLCTSALGANDEYFFAVWYGSLSTLEATDTMYVSRCSVDSAAWETPIPLVTDEYFIFVGDPEIVVKGDSIFICFYGRVEGEYQTHLYGARSLDGGDSYALARFPSSQSEHQRHPKAAFRGDTIVIAYRYWRPAIETSIYWTISPDWGESWAQGRVARDNSQGTPRLYDCALLGNRVYISFSYSPVSHTECFYIHTAIDSEVWSEPQSISLVDNYLSTNPHMCTGGNGVLHAVWTDMIGSSNWFYNVFYRQSSDSGRSWSDPVMIHHLGWAFLPELSAWGDHLIVLWSDHRDEIHPYGTVSLDGGITWEPEQKISDNTIRANIDGMCLAAEHGFMVIWTTYETLHDTTYTPVVGKRAPVVNWTEPRVQPDHARQPDFTIYPNPVHNHALIQINGGRRGNVTLSLYNILGQKLFNSEYRINGDVLGQSFTIPIPMITLGLPAGIYFIEMRQNHLRYTKKLVFLP